MIVEKDVCFTINWLFLRMSKTYIYYTIVSLILSFGKNF
jgi:hypothetical protein